MTTTTVNADHLRMRNTERGDFEMICEHCGLRLVIVLPAPMNSVPRAMNQFVRNHRHCKPKGASAQTD